MRILIWLNVGVWAVSLVALAFMTEHLPSMKGLLPILIGGAGVAIALLSLMYRRR
jgi:hypothetical protein